ncbi:MAG: hypothetical protein SCH66_09595 [Methanolobus sp.]|nr:hypothetical protein [Methanolobus sp.]
METINLLIKYISLKNLYLLTGSNLINWKNNIFHYKILGAVIIFSMFFLSMGIASDYDTPSKDNVCQNSGSDLSHTDWSSVDWGSSKWLFNIGKENSTTQGREDSNSTKINGSPGKNISSSIWENYSDVNWVMSEQELMRLRNASSASNNCTKEKIVVRSRPYDESDYIDYDSPIVLKIVNGPRTVNENGTITYLNTDEDVSKVTLYPVKKSLYTELYQTPIVLTPAEYGSRLRNCCFGSIFKVKYYA